MLTRTVRHRRTATPSADFRWSSAVAAFGMVLRQSPQRGAASLELVRSLARLGLGGDPHGERHELLQLVERAARLGLDSPAKVATRH